jgi:hypothetical protein
MSKPGNWAALSLVVGALFFAGCKSGSHTRDDNPTSDGSHPSTELLPAGTILRYRIGGGIEGYSDRLDISEDRIARLYLADKLASAAHLTASDAEVLDSLRARSGRINLAYSSPVNISEPMGSSILFDGKGSAPLTREVSDLAQRLRDRLRPLSYLWQSTIIIVGRANDPPQGSSAPAGVQITVDRVLKQPEALGLLPGAVIKVDSGDRIPRKSRGQTGCWIVDPDAARDDDGSWHGRYAGPSGLAEEAIADVLKEQRELGPTP